MNNRKHLCAAVCGLALLAASVVEAQVSQPVSVPADDARWELHGEARVAEYRGRKCLLLGGGAAALKDFEMRDGVFDVDVITAAPRGFFGIQFRIAGDGNAEWVYLRQHKSGLPDAMQYTPVLNGGLNWQIYSGPGFTGAVDIPKDTWFHLRLAVSGFQAKLYVGDMERPALVVNDLKGNAGTGVALAVLTGDTCFANFEVRPSAAAAPARQQVAVPPGTLTKWSLSQSFRAIERNLERPLSPAERDSVKWEDVEAEPPGLVVIGRYRSNPGLRVSFANDFSKRLEPQPGMRVVYARAVIDSDVEQVKKLYIGYSDDVSVFLNGRILFRGRSAQHFRDPAFLGIVDPENDAVYLPLQTGTNELVLAVSDLGGGWGFICRLENHRGG